MINRSILLRQGQVTFPYRLDKVKLDQVRIGQTSLNTSATKLSKEIINQIFYCIHVFDQHGFLLSTVKCKVVNANFQFQTVWPQLHFRHCNTVFVIAVHNKVLVSMSLACFRQTDQSCSRNSGPERTQAVHKFKSLSVW